MTRRQSTTVIAFAAVALLAVVAFFVPGKRAALGHVYALTTGERTLDGTYDIAVLGDSHAELGRWHRVLPGRRIGNFGVGGEEIAEIARRVDRVITAKAATAFIFAGTNDLLHGRSPQDAVRDLRPLIEALQSRGVAVRVNALFCLQPAKWRHPGIRQLACDEFLAFNRLARPLVTEAGAIFIDIATPLMHGDQLRLDFTNDGLHLNERGYEVLRAIWSRYLPG